MKKIKLNLEDLKVQSFVVDETKNAKGTVLGNLPPGEDGGSVACGGGTGYTGLPNTCNGAHTCGATEYYSCAETCEARETCGYTCGMFDCGTYGSCGNPLCMLETGNMPYC